MNPRFYMANLAPNHILRDGSIPEVFFINHHIQGCYVYQRPEHWRRYQKRDLLTCKEEKAGMQRKATCKRFFLLSSLVLCWVQYIYTCYVPTGQSVGG